MVLSAVYRRHNAAVRYWSRLTTAPTEPDAGRRVDRSQPRVRYRLGSESETRSSAFVGT